MGNLQVRFLEGWAPAMAPGHSTVVAEIDTSEDYFRLARTETTRCLLAVFARSNLPQVATWVLDHRPSIAIRLI
jgi:hypothetical protein